MNGSPPFFAPCTPFSPANPGDKTRAGRKNDGNNSAENMTPVPLPLSHPSSYCNGMKTRFQPPISLFILDRSGSMAPLTEAAIAGFNEFFTTSSRPRAGPG